MIVDGQKKFLRYFSKKKHGVDCFSFFGFADGDVSGRNFAFPVDYVTSISIDNLPSPVVVGLIEGHALVYDFTNRESYIQ